MADALEKRLEHWISAGVIHGATNWKRSFR
jgi:hypothetical protein